MGFRKKDESIVGGFGDAVWERQGGGDTISTRAYATLICFWTALGIGASAVAATISLHWAFSWMLVILPFIASIVGTIIALKSDNPVVSLFGYALVVIPFGLMLGPVVNLYTVASVAKVLFITTGMVVGLGVVGAVYPKSLESWGSWLMGALLVLILGSCATMIAGAFGVNIRGAMTVWDWVGVAVFSALVIFDLNRAMRLPKTVDNSVDSALAIYLDFVNIFIRLLSIMGKKK